MRLCLRPLIGPQIGAFICIGWEIRCLPYAGFSSSFFLQTRQDITSNISVTPEIDHPPWYWIVPGRCVPPPVPPVPRRGPPPGRPRRALSLSLPPAAGRWGRVIRPAPAWRAGLSFGGRVSPLPVPSRGCVSPLPVPARGCVPSPPTPVRGCLFPLCPPLLPPSPRPSGTIGVANSL